MSVSGHIYIGKAVHRRNDYRPLDKPLFNMAKKHNVLFIYYRDISDTGTSDSLDQSNGDQVLRLTSLIGELQREVIDLKGARNTAEQKLDRILLSLPKQYSSTYSM